MPDITLSLPDELHARLAALASQAGQSPSEFALAALTDKIRDALYDAEMDAQADRRWAEFQQTGKSLPLDEVEKRWEQRLAGSLAWANVQSGPPGRPRLGFGSTLLSPPKEPS